MIQRTSIFLCFMIIMLTMDCFALDMVLRNGKLAYPIPIMIVDTAGNPLTGQNLSNINLYYSCGGQAGTQFNETGDTLTQTDSTNGSGIYDWTSDDTLTGCIPLTNIKIYGNGADMVIPAAVYGLIMDGITICQITAATSGSSFTIGTCTDRNGAIITLSTNYFHGSSMEAITRSGSQCNVIGHSILAEGVTSGGIVTASPGTGFPAIPSTANCNVKIEGAALTGNIPTQVTGMNEGVNNLASTCDIKATVTSACSATTTTFCSNRTEATGSFQGAIPAYATAMTGTASNSSGKVTAYSSVNGQFTMASPGLRAAPSTGDYICIIQK